MRFMSSAADCEVMVCLNAVRLVRLSISAGNATVDSCHCVTRVKSECYQAYHSKYVTCFIGLLTKVIEMFLES